MAPVRDWTRDVSLRVPWTRSFQSTSILIPPGTWQADGFMRVVPRRHHTRQRNAPGPLVLSKTVRLLHRLVGSRLTDGTRVSAARRLEARRGRPSRTLPFDSTRCRSHWLAGFLFLLTRYSFQLIRRENVVWWWLGVISRCVGRYYLEYRVVPNRENRLTPLRLWDRMSAINRFTLQLRRPKLLANPRQQAVPIDDPPAPSQIISDAYWYPCDSQS